MSLILTDFTAQTDISNCPSLPQGQRIVLDTAVTAIQIQNTGSVPIIVSEVHSGIPKMTIIGNSTDSCEIAGTVFLYSPSPTTCTLTPYVRKTGLPTLAGANTFAALNTFSAGITFGQTTLNYYEESTFTLNIVCNGANATGTISAKAIRVGKLVTYFISWSDISFGGNTGAVTFTGFPYTTSASGGGAPIYYPSTSNAVFLTPSGTGGIPFVNGVAATNSTFPKGTGDIVKVVVETTLY